MIHSLAGGEIGKTTFDDYAKIELMPPNNGVYWYKTMLFDLCVGDIVLVPFGKASTLVQGKVLRIDKSISSQNSPIPSKRARYIFSKVSK